MAKKIVTDLNVQDKKVLMRVDFNVPNERRKNNKRQQNSCSSSDK